MPDLLLNWDGTLMWCQCNVPISNCCSPLSVSHSSLLSSSEDISMSKVAPIGHMLAQTDPHFPSRRVRRTPLYAAAAKGKHRLARVLLALGQNPDRTDEYGITPLQIATWKDHCRVVKYLIRHSRNLDLCDWTGHSALFKAVWRGCTQCVLALLKAGAECNLPDKMGNSALMLAAEFGRLQLLVSLIEAGADPNMANMRNETALFIATIHGNINCVRLLLAAKADPNIVTRDGCTPLFYAITRRNDTSSSDAVKVLLRWNADTELKGSDFTVCYGRPMTAFEYAVHVGNHMALRMLVEADCDLTPMMQWRDGASIPTVWQDNPSLFQTLKQASKQPKSLASICRKTIRTSMTDMCHLEKLFLPHVLLDFLKLKDLDRITDFKTNPIFWYTACRVQKIRLIVSHIQNGAVITRSIFSKFLTMNTP